MNELERWSEKCSMYHHLFHGDDATTAAAIVGAAAAIVRAVISVRLLEGIAAPRISTHVVEHAAISIIIGTVVIRRPRVVIVSRHRVRSLQRIARSSVSRVPIVALVLPQPFLLCPNLAIEKNLIRLVHNSIQSPTCTPTQ